MAGVKSNEKALGNHEGHSQTRGNFLQNSLPEERFLGDFLLR